MPVTSSSPDIELLPCPFCGSEAEFERHGTNRQSSIVACQECGARVETSETWNEGQLWSTRACQPATPTGGEESDEFNQHIAWLKQYVEGMTAANWQDMRLRAERQLEQISKALDGRELGRSSAGTEDELGPLTQLIKEASPLASWDMARLILDAGYTRRDAAATPRNPTLTELAQALVGIQEDMPSADVRNTLGLAAHYLEKFARGDDAQPMQYPRRGIYIASKTRHADRWIAMREAGVPIISTWIDEAGPGASADLDDLWQRCISEACLCAVLIVYREPEDTLKGAWIEMGAALARGTPVFAVGLREYTVANYRGLRHFETIEEAFEAAAISSTNRGGEA